MFVRPKCFIDNGDNQNICDDIGESLYCSRCTSYKHWTTAYELNREKYLTCPMCGTNLWSSAWLPDECRDNQMEYWWDCYCGLHTDTRTTPITQEDIDKIAEKYQPQVDPLVELLREKLPDEDQYEYEAFEQGDGMTNYWELGYHEHVVNPLKCKKSKDYTKLLEELE